MVKILHFFIGTITIEIIGSSMERFLNICANQNIILWDVKPTKDGYSFFIQPKEYPYLMDIQKKTNTKMKIIGRHGLPFFIQKHKKKKCFVIGFLVSFFLLFALSQFIWGITVAGNESYSKEEILAYVENQKYRLGTLKSKIDCGKLEERIRETYGEIAWVSCSLKGTRLHIEIKETLDRKTKQNAKKPCDIIASESGRVTKISVKSGTPLVRVGDQVKKGDTLISGMIYYYSDDYKVMQTDQTIADGQILVERKQVYEEVLPMRYYKKNYMSESTRVVGIKVGRKKIPIPIQQPKGKIEKKEQIKKIHIGENLYLPVQIYLRRYRKYEPELIQLSKKSGENRLKKRWNSYRNSLEKKGIKIKDAKISFYCKDAKCYGKGYLYVEESIGKIRNIHALTKKQEKMIQPTTAAPQ